MGVPKFYRWLSERYPCLSEVVKEHQIPDFDNFYLDMNGIIHVCSHPNDNDPHFRITEEKIFENIFHYIEVLFRMIKPKKVMFLAVDGVAPRAKMNQQRSRRFRSAKEAEVNEKKARDRGEELPSEARFDSNCITPGTDFMVRLQAQLQYFISNKISTDPLWQNVSVILSGHDTPGEGEHKIMDYIRYEKSKPGYDPNIRHCLYGLDADLIILGLCTHDPHFSLLREKVSFGGKKSRNADKRISNPEETTFHLLHLSLLREYLEHEFSCLKRSLPFPFDLEAIIDDWILLGFLVGNDFIPHLPHIHINTGGLHELYGTYKAVLPRLDGYLNEAGTLNLARFEVFMKALAENEMERFDGIYSDAKWIEGKTAKKNSSGNRTVKATPGPANVYEILEGAPDPAISTKGPADNDLQRLLTSVNEFVSDDEEDETEELDSSTTLADTEPDEDANRDSYYHMEFRQHKRDYYIKKMGYPKVDDSVLLEQAHCYVTALQWNLHYYYDGCASWSWYYPHHYAPWITDIKGFSNLKLNFELSKPFHPFEQLLAVLPAASKELLPLPLRGLMVNETSPIIDFYPEEFKCDLNGKQQEWEAVVLIPFIDEERLLTAMAPLLSHLKPEEKSRNKHGAISVFQYTPENLGSLKAPAFFPAITQNHAKLDLILRAEWDVPRAKLKKGLMKGVKLSVYFPGFPTLAHIPHTASIEKAGVKVFEQASRGENMLLYLEEELPPRAEVVAADLLNKEIWVSWPHMVEAKVVSVMSKTKSFSLSDDGIVVVKANAHSKQILFAQYVSEITSNYKNRWGIVIGETTFLVQACVMTGRKYIWGHKNRITLEKQWSKSPQPFAYQAIRKDILCHDPSFTQYRTLEELFPPGVTCFMLGHPLYGRQGQVQTAGQDKGMIKLNFIDPQEPNFQEVIQRAKNSGNEFYSCHECAVYLGLPVNVMMLVTGTFLVNKSPVEVEADRQSKVNIGLNLKFNKANEEVCGYTKKTNGVWYYSQALTDVVAQYMEKFPGIFEAASDKRFRKTNVVHMKDLFNDEEELKEVLAWLKDLPCASAPRQPCGSLTLDETMVRQLEADVDSQLKSLRKREVVMQVRPHLLYNPTLFLGMTVPDDRTKFNLFDRVVNVRQGITVPLGMKGTVTGIYGVDDKGRQSPEKISLDILFDKPFPGGLSIKSSSGRSYRLPAAALLNLTFGMGLEASARPAEGAAKMVSAAAKQSPVKPMSMSMAAVVKGKAKVGSKDKSPGVTPDPNLFAAANIKPPDPTSLPDPMALFGQPKKESEKPKKQIHVAKKGVKNGDESNFSTLWNSLQAMPARPHVESDLSQDLKSLLNIGQAAKEEPNSVQTFFQAAAEVVEPMTYQNSLQKVLKENEWGPAHFSYEQSKAQKGLSHVFAKVKLPWGMEFTSCHLGLTKEAAAEEATKMAFDFITINGIPIKSKQQFKANNTSFVPMQVSKKQVAKAPIKQPPAKAQSKSSPKRNGNHHDNVAKSKSKSSSVAPRQDYPKNLEAQGEVPKKKREGKKSKIAANFGGS